MKIIVKPNHSSEAARAISNTKKPDNNLILAGRQSECRHCNHCFVLASMYIHTFEL